MACAAYTKLYPPSPQMTITYEQFITNQASQDGQLCAIGNYQTCASQCSQMSKNYPGCFNCLSNFQTCANQQVPASQQEPCCPFVAEAVTCSNCLGLYSSDALQQCLQTGLSTAAWVGIGIAIAVVLIIIAVLIYVFYIRQKRQAETRAKLGISDAEINAIELQNVLQRR